MSLRHPGREVTTGEIRHLDVIFNGLSMLSKATRAPVVSGGENTPSPRPPGLGGGTEQALLGSSCSEQSGMF